MYAGVKTYEFVKMRSRVQQMFSNEVVHMIMYSCIRYVRIKNCRPVRTIAKILSFLFGIILRVHQFVLTF
jgi:hypothetical protein